MKAKRVRCEVRYSRSEKSWLFINSNGEVIYDLFTKKSAIKRAALVCRKSHVEFGELIELTIKRKNGTIQDKRTYGRDPRKTKG